MSELRSEIVCGVGSLACRRTSEGASDQDCGVGVSVSKEERAVSD